MRAQALLLCLAALAVGGASTRTALAREPTAAEAESALELYKAGKKLRASGDTAGALEKFKAAHALAETPITALELAKTHAELGHLVEAREIALAVSRLPVRKNESKKATEARDEAPKLAAELKPRLAQLTLKIANAKPGATVRVDGVVVPEEAWTAPRVANPGAHKVEIELGDKRTEKSVTLAEGESRELAVEAPAAVAEPAPPPTPVSSPPPGTDAPRSGTSPLVWAGFGLAVVGVGVGAVTGLMTLSKASTLDASCRDGRCPPSAQPDLDSASTTGTISTVAFIAGGVGAAIGVVGLFSSGKSAPATTGASRAPELLLSPQGAGLRGTF